MKVLQAVVLVTMLWPCGLAWASSDDPYNLVTPPTVESWPDETTIKQHHQLPSISTANDIKIGDSYFHAIDINRDGGLDWFVYSLDSCGSRGCEGDVFICKTKTTPCSNRAYCYAGTGHQKILETAHTKLKCENRVKAIGPN
jgi:hypothetical protein